MGNCITSEEFDELEGRIEALTRAFLTLAGRSAQCGVIDADWFAKGLAAEADHLALDTPSNDATRRTLQELSRAIALGAKTHRSPGGPAGKKA